jgi:hypothetical protein
MQKVTEMIQSGMVTLQQGRRLLDFPDLQQVETLANASEERIYQMLDDIIEDGKYESPDPFLDLMLAKQTVVQYYNLYAPAKLEQDKQQMLRGWYSQVNALIQAAQPPAMPPQGAPMPQAAPMPQQQSDLVPNGPGAPPAAAPSAGAPQ